MEKMQLLLREDGREARNLLAFHVSVNEGKIFRKPPNSPRAPEPRTISKKFDSEICVRPVRSASTGRDKRSELRARYWALLFGNLQRAVNEIYNTVETHESVIECQETILVMENYIRDFRSLSEWFKLKWEYENTPAPQRPTSLAWEVRKANLPNSALAERVSPIPSIKQGRVSPQTKQKDQIMSKIDNGVIATSPQPEPIPEMDEKTKDSIEERQITNLKKENTSEVVLSPSEDQKTYVKIFKNVSVSSAEVGTITDDIEAMKIAKKTSNQKVSQASQTDEENVEKSNSLTTNVTSNISPPKTTIKCIESRSSRMPISSSARPAYSFAVSRTVKPAVKSATSMPPKTSAPTTKISTIANNTKMSPNKQIRPPFRNIRGSDVPKKSPNSALLRSKTSGEIKTTSNSPVLTKQRTSLSIRNGPVPTKVSSSVKAPVTKPTFVRKSSTTVNVNKSSMKSNLSEFTSKLNNEMRDSDKESINSSVETIVNAPTRSSNDTEEKESSHSKLVNGMVTSGGWLTVKAQRRPSSHWSNRFNEVSGTTSLPALALLQESDDESDEKTNPRPQTTQGKPSVSYLKRTNTVLTRSSVKSFTRKNEYLNNQKSKSEEPCLNKNDVNNKLGLKNGSKIKLDNKTKLDKQKSQEKLSTSLSHQNEKLLPRNIEIDLKPQNSTSKLLSNENYDRKIENESEYDSKLNGDDMEKSEIHDEEEHCRKTQQLSDEEAMLTQEIAELESCSVDVDTETDGTETDGEVGDEDEEVPALNSAFDDLSLEARYEPVLAGLSWGERMDTLAALEDLVARHPGRALQLHQKLSNPNRRRSLPETLRRYQAKHARAQQRRQALQQERTVRLQALLARVQDVKAAKNQLIEEKRVRMENRLQRAELNRNEHLKSVIRKAHDEEEKLREIAFIKELEAQNKRHDFLELCKEQKGRLEDLREGQRKKIEEQAARGAAVEERRRALEQARHDRLERLQAERELRAERVGRRQLEIQEQAREKARGREERLSALHAQQLASTRELQKRISQKQKESARRHEENIEQIRQKALELSILRSHNDDPHTPALTPYESQKMCSVCNVHINSEVYLLSHLRGRSHQEAVRLASGSLVGDQLEQYELAHIVDAPVDENHPKLVAARERSKILRKRCKKIRQRMTSKGAIFESEYKAPSVNNQNKRPLAKSSQKFLSLINQGWASTTYNQLDRILGETNRLLIKNVSNDLIAFQSSGWFSALAKLFLMGLDETTTTPPTKSLVTACNVWQAACKNGNSGASNCKYTILSNKIIVILDLLNNKLKGLANDDQLPSEPLATATMQLLATILQNVPSDTPTGRVQDVVSYAVCVGIVEQLAQCCVSVRGPVHNNENACSFLLAALDLLTGLAQCCGPPPLETIIQTPSTPTCNGTKNDDNNTIITEENKKPMKNNKNNNNNQNKSTRSNSLVSSSSTTSSSCSFIDPTHFTAALHATELVGVVSMLYGTLLPTGASPRCEGKAPDALPTPCLALATSVFRLLRQVAELDLKRFQEALGAEGISLQFRHIVGHLLWTCASPPAGSGDAENASTELLHEVIAVTGYFAIKNNDNQMLLVSGYAPSVLQQLCSLPFAYFSVPKLSAILYPTLLGCCYDNPHTRQILEQELSFVLLEDFMKTEEGLHHPLVKLLLNNDLITQEKPNCDDNNSKKKEIIRGSRLTCHGLHSNVQWITFID
ncbi:S phase cyclin A-associated protein in the endoplasmic reticulum [Chrysoperla carnea]|uniref:S phase cyclin A-associated protein in the endoplasmic reticulum n=1 Tax=Chrysoperla carnea TaxID=189513 RepID=UPI001D06AA8F|nr:S phase cyclin A-associated protein in the endoplasmic reticulum [Chrysoperla carnea]